MADLPYPEPLRLDIIAHLEEIRKRILVCLGFLTGFAVIAFLKVDILMAVVKIPANGRINELIFISPTEGFASAIKISFLTAFIAAFPVILYQAWRFIQPALPAESSKRVLVWVYAALALFFLGTAFSYFVAIPAALEFLMGFGSRIASSNITLGKYTSFVGSLLVIGGVIFELPVVLAILTEAGLVSTKTLAGKRHLAVLALLVFAAFITPTQDIVNLLIIAIPMYLLYEIGIIICKIIERSRKG